MAVISFYGKESTLPTEVIKMRHLGLGLMACLLLVGMGVAQDGFEHREFTNQEGVYLSYYINAGGFIENGELALTDGVYLSSRAARVNHWNMSHQQELREYYSSSHTTIRTLTWTFARVTT
jgi:hypothetical protein